MPSRVLLTGQDAVRRRIERMRLRCREALPRAVEECLEVLEAAAQAILEAEIYEKPRAPFAPELDRTAPEALYSSFVKQVTAFGAAQVTGFLYNTSPHAGFIEFGTDDEGTGSHFVPVVRAGALHWINPETGTDMFDKAGHEVKGIVPIRFLERAMKENRAHLIAVFRQHFLAAIID